jgi:ATP-dependent Clp protease ATP-binding subunit ClpA
VTPRTVNSTISLIKQYEPEQPLVGKCLDIFDTLLTRAASLGKKNILISDVTDLMNVKDLKKISSAEVKSFISEKIYGQPHAIDSMLRCIETYLCRLNAPNKPIGSFLMTGQTGTGKTELAKAVASALGFDLIKFNMSDYSEKHSISGLIGSKSGYVGYEEGGALTNSLKQHPRCVLLLDEVEKAHPDVYNIFLNMIDEGYIKDSKDNYVSCSNVIIVMTTNLSAASELKKSIGFCEKAVSLEDKMIEVKKFFRPEFLARLTDVIAFQPISDKTCDGIAYKFLKQLATRNSDLDIKFTQELISMVAQKGFVAQVGGRSILHYIEKNVIPILCDFVLKNKSCKKITLDWLDNGVVACKSC